MSEKRDTFPLLCFKDRELTGGRVNESKETSCTICGQTVWQAPTAMMAVLDDEGNEMEKLKMIEQGKVNLKPVCTDCARDMWSAMNIVKPHRSKPSKYNQNESQDH